MNNAEKMLEATKMEYYQLEDKEKEATLSYRAAVLVAAESGETGPLQQAEDELEAILSAKARTKKKIATLEQEVMRLKEEAIDSAAKRERVRIRAALDKLNKGELEEATNKVINSYWLLSEQLGRLSIYRTLCQKNNRMVVEEYPELVNKLGRINELVTNYSNGPLGQLEQLRTRITGGLTLPRDIFPSIKGSSPYPITTDSLLEKIVAELNKEK